MLGGIGKGKQACNVCVLVVVSSSDTEPTLTFLFESAIFGTWIAQIFMSEVLDIPVSIETNYFGGSLDFYDPGFAFDWGVDSGVLAEFQGTQYVK